jgi:hypothetical protein
MDFLLGSEGVYGWKGMKALETGADPGGEWGWELRLRAPQCWSPYPSKQERVDERSPMIAWRRTAKVRQSREKREDARMTSIYAPGAFLLVRQFNHMQSDLLAAVATGEVDHSTATNVTLRSLPVTPTRMRVTVRARRELSRSRVCASGVLTTRVESW